MAIGSRTLSHWYTQLANSLEAGLSLERSIGAVPGPPGEMRSRLQARLAAGDSVGQALEHGGSWLPPVDRQLMTAACEAGRLPDVLRRLAARHAEAARAGGMAFAAALYPLAIAHFAVLSLPLTNLVQGGGATAYVGKVAQVLVPLWLLAAVAWVAVRRRWGVARRVLDALPFVGGYRRLRAIADLAMVLEAQLVAGIRLDVAWLQAAMASGDERLEPVAIAVAEGIQRGEAVGPKLAGRRELPAPFADFYLNGEQTGRLDESLGYVQREFQSRAQGRLRQAAVFYPALLFVGVAAFVVFKVLTFWLGYFRQLEQVAP